MRKALKHQNRVAPGNPGIQPVEDSEGTARGAQRLPPLNKSLPPPGGARKSARPQLAGAALTAQAPQAPQAQTPSLAVE